MNGENAMNMEAIFLIMGTAFCIGLTGAVMPGPLLAVTVSQSIRRGFRAGPLIVLGHAILESILVVAVVLGCMGFLQDARVVDGMAVLGGVIMMWMAQGMIRSAKGLSLNLDGSADAGMSPVAAGIVISLSNPYWIIWWATIGITYVFLGMKHGGWGVLAFFVGHISADLVWYCLVSAAVARGRRMMSDTVYRGLIAFCGVFLAAFGAWFLGQGVGGLSG
jgi:threonine/homoserine/homoserine lactone efflux protein